MVIDTKSLEILNPWWTNPHAHEQDPHLIAVLNKPWYFDHPIKKALQFQMGHSFLIRGPRQIGKTTLMKELIARAISSDNIKAAHCLFLTCEAIENYSELQQILVDWLKAKQHERLFLCLDEITFVEEWQRGILWLLNSGLLRKSFLLISGSNARDLKKMAERFPGRNVKEMSLFPLSLRDYASLPCFQHIDAHARFQIYLEVGGFPHAIRDYCQLGGVSDETYETYANWIFGDAHRFELSRDILVHIMFRIFDTLTSQVTYQRLIEKSPVKSHETAAAYVAHLELAFLCHVLGCYDPDKDMEAPRKAKKIYFIDPLLYAVAGGLLRGLKNIFEWWKNKLQDSEMRGKIFEAVVVNHFTQKYKRVYSWYSSNTQREADILVREGEELRLYEVKNRIQKLLPLLGRQVEIITP